MVLIFQGLGPTGTFQKKISRWKNLSLQRTIDHTRRPKHLDIDKGRQIFFLVKSKIPSSPILQGRIRKIFCLFFGVKTMRMIAQICVAFSEKLNFKKGSHKQVTIDTISSENKPTLATKKKQELKNLQQPLQQGLSILQLGMPGEPEELIPWGP